MEVGVFDILGKGLQEIQKDNYMTLSTRISYTLLEEDLNSEFKKLIS
jgi:hypothetical protein